MMSISQPYTSKQPYTHASNNDRYMLHHASVFGWMYHLEQQSCPLSDNAAFVPRKVCTLMPHGKAVT